MTTRAGHWRVLPSPAGPGHVVFLRSAVTNDEIRIYADNIALARWLQQEILSAGEFSDQTIPVVSAVFSRPTAGRPDEQHGWLSFIGDLGAPELRLMALLALCERRPVMADPMTLSVAAIGAVALTEGIKFLYGQAGELLKRWRERRDKAAQAAAAPTEQTEVVEVMLPAVFEGQLSGAVIHFDVLQQSERDLRRLYKDLSEYANEIEPVDSANDALLQNVDMLRQLLEAVYQQRITFKGEERPPSGSPLVIGRVEAQEISGGATGVEAEEAVGGEIRGDVKAERIAPGGHAIGAKVGSVGRKSPRSKPSDS